MNLVRSQVQLGSSWPYTKKPSISPPVPKAPAFCRVSALIVVVSFEWRAWFEPESRPRCGFLFVIRDTHPLRKQRLGTCYSTSALAYLCSEAKGTDAWHSRCDVDQAEADLSRTWRKLHQPAEVRPSLTFIVCSVATYSPGSTIRGGPPSGSRRRRPGRSSSRWPPTQSGSAEEGSVRSARSAWRAGQARPRRTPLGCSTPRPLCLQQSPP